MSNLAKETLGPCGDCPGALPHSDTRDHLAPYSTTRIWPFLPHSYLPQRVPRKSAGTIVCPVNQVHIHVAPIVFLQAMLYEPARRSYSV